MSPTNTKLAILFADISGSTRLFETLGDDKAREIIADTLNLLGSVVEHNNGTVIKTIGDEIMCTFETANQAATACCEMQEQLESANYARSEDSPEIKIRIGMHYGPALTESGDVYGDAVNVAARMAAQSKGGQIITTKTTVDLLEPTLGASSRFVDNATIKGKKDIIQIFEILWQEEDATTMASGILDSTPTSNKIEMELDYKGQKLSVSSDLPTIVMGRGQSCDLAVMEPMASRQHVRIELRRNKFFIVDQSTNGTYVRLENADTTFLRREEMPVQMNGEISLGKAFAEDPTEIISYKLVI